MRKKIVAALLGAGLLAGGSAYAAQQAQTKPAPRGPLAGADTNRDGIVTRQEVQASADARFAKLDTNKDGQISAEERRAARPEHKGRHHRSGGAQHGKRHAQMLERFDADKDGKLSDAERQTARAALRAEFGDRREARTEMRAKLLERFDADKDGKLGPAERKAARDARRAMRGESGQGLGRRHGPGYGFRVDANGDKLVSLAESRAAALAMFDRFDADKDGRIDAAEREAVRAKMKAMRVQRGGAQAPAPAGAPEAPNGN